MNPDIKRFLIRLAIALLTIIVIRALLPKKTVLGDVPTNLTPTKLILIPTEGIPTVFIQDLKSILEKQHKFRILVSTEMGIPSDGRIANSKQYNSDVLASVGQNVLDSLKRDGAYGLVLTNEDINYPDSSLNFVFSTHYRGLSVVSLPVLIHKILALM